MEFNTAHDIIHEDNQNQSELCPVCSGDLKAEDAIAKAGDIIKRQRTARTSMNQMKMYGGEWTSADISALPDSSFAYIDPEGQKHLPYKDKDGVVDLPHVRNALARLDQVKGMPAEKVASVKSMLEGLLQEKKAGEDALFNNLLNSSAHIHKARVYPLTQIIADEKGGLPDEIQIMPIGKWDTVPYGELSISASDLEEMKSNFDKGYRAGVPIDVDHDSKAAAGWIQSLRVADDGLYAKVEWSKLGKDLLDGKMYKFFSPEFNPEYTDPENKELKLKNVLIAGSLVNRPLFKELKPVIASDHLTAKKSGVMLFIDMNLVELKKKQSEGATLTADELAFVKAADTTHKADDACAMCDKCSEKMHTASEHTHTDMLKGKEKMVTISASELQKMQEDSAAGRKAAEKLEAKEIEDTVTNWMFSEDGGHFQPAIKDPLVKFYTSLTNEQRKTFGELVEKMPSQKYLFGEAGSAEDLTPGGAADTITLKAKELISNAAKEKRTLKFSDAVKQVLKDNPEMSDYDLTPIKGKVVAK